MGPQTELFGENLAIAGWQTPTASQPKRAGRRRFGQANAHFMVVRMERLELSRVAPLEPNSSASTKFATVACGIMLDYTLCIMRLQTANHFALAIGRFLQPFVRCHPSLTSLDFMPVTQRSDRQTY